ncbi:MAG: DUF3307 domain-containing protein [Gemmatimonadales bacterium]|jgi:hypothetical protein
MTATGAWLLVALLVAHDLGDFTPLATERMREAKARGRPAWLIGMHAAIHGALVGVALLIVVRPSLTVLALAVGFELVTHFLIDLSKARLGIRVPSLGDMHTNPFWWVMGVDQLLHGLVLVGIAFMVLA